MSLGKAVFVASALAYLAIGTSLLIREVNAARVVELTLEEKVALSDVVVVGVAISAPREIRSTYGFDDFVAFKVEAALKGQPGSEIELLVRGSFAEWVLECCEQGDRYLLFLRKIDKNRYFSANAKFGVYQIKK